MDNNTTLIIKIARGAKTALLASDGRGGTPMKYRKMMLGALVAVMLAFCGHLDTYSETVTATANTIRATDRNGATVTLTECRTDDGDRLLLEGVEEGHRYRVRLDSFGTWSREDDAIITVKEEQRQ